MSRHLSRAEILCYLDGEVSWLRRLQYARHLESCWCCRSDRERLEETILNVVVVQETVLAAATPAPPRAWRSMQDLIQIQERHRQTAAPSFGIRNIALWLQVAGAVVLLMAATGVVVMRFWHVSTVSAREVLQRVQTADAEREQLPSGHVIRQRIHVTRTSHRHAADSDDEVDAWKSGTATVWSPGEKGSAAESLKREYDAHQIPMSLPLEGKAVNAWVRLAGGMATARAVKDEIVLHFGDAADGDRPTVELQVEPDAWTVREMRLNVEGTSYRITENNFAVLPVAAVPATILAMLQPPENMGRPVAVPHSVVASSLSAAQIKLTELTVALALHRVNADLGEPITLNSSNRGVEVGVWQLPGERQQEVREALAGVNHVTVALAAPHAARDLSPTPAGGAEIPETGTEVGRQSVAPIESDTHALRLMGGVAGEQIFVGNALEKYDAVMAQVYALRNLADRFGQESEAGLPEMSREGVVLLIHDHASKASAALSDLQNAMAPLNTLYSGMPADMEISPVLVNGSWQARSNHALELAREANATLRGVLTSSSAPVDPHTGVPAVQRELSALAAELLALQQEK